MTVADLRIALPILILAVGALLTLISGAVTRNRVVGFTIAFLAAIGAGLWAMQPQATHAAPSLGLAASGLTRLFTAFFAFMSAAVLVLAKGPAHRPIQGEEYPATILFTAFGMVVLACASNLLVIFLGLEAMTFGFYILAAIDRRRDASGEAGLKFLLMGVLSAAFLAFGIGLLYCIAGTLVIDQVVQHTLSSPPFKPMALAGWGCLVFGIVFKLSLVPGHLWTPDIYQAAPAPVVAFLSGGSKAATILLMLLLWVHAEGLAVIRIPLAAMALLSMLVGNFAALRQSNVRRILAYSSIAQMGYVTVAIISHPGNGFQAAAFYAVAYGIMSIAAFGALGVIEPGSRDANVDDLRGRGFTHPLAGITLAVALFALAGIPPSIGFTGKFLIFASALRAGEYFLAIIGILTAAVSIYYYLRIAAALYLYKPENEENVYIDIIPAGVLMLSATLIVLLGIFPSQLLEFLQIHLQ